MRNVSISQRGAPHGYTEDWDESIWNVGHIFQWSIVHQQWVDQLMTATVKPGQCLADAFRSRLDRNSTWREGWLDNFNIYFLESNHASN